MSSLRIPFVAILFLVVSSLHAQDSGAPAPASSSATSDGSTIGGFFKQVGHSLGQTAKQIGAGAVQSVTHTGGRIMPVGGGAVGTTTSGNDGIHGDPLDGGMGWNRFVFDPPNIDGYTHIRWGASAQSRYNSEGTSGEANCDPNYIGMAVVGQSMPTPNELFYCLGQERILDPSATEDTVRKRIAELGATRKYYYRGQLHGMLWNLPGQPRLTPTDKDAVIQLLGGAASGMVQGEVGLSFNIVGPHWSWGEVSSGPFGGWPGPSPNTMSSKGDSIYKLVIDIDHTKVVSTQLTSLSYVFFTVGTPRMIYEDRRQKMYDLSVRIDKIVFVGNGFRSEYDEKEPMP